MPRRGARLQLSFEAAAAPPAEAAAPEPDPSSAAPREDASRPVATETDEPRANRLRRISPAFFTVGAIASVGLAGATVWSGIDVLGRNDNYETDPTKAGFDQGSQAELRTNVLIGATAAVGVTTILFAVFTDWPRWSRRSRKNATSMVVAPSLTKPGLVLVGRFGL